MRKNPVVVINCAQLVTLSGPARPRIGAEMREMGVIEDGMMIFADRIERVGSREEIEPSISQDVDVIDAGGRIVLPGFVDAHTHLVFAGNRLNEFEQRASGATYQEIAAAGGGIRSTVRQTRAADENELLAQSVRHSSLLMSNGTTTAEVKSGYGLTLEDELKMLRVIRRLNEETPLRCVPTFLGAHTIPDEFTGRSSQYVDLVVNEMLPIVARERLAEYCDVFCEEGAFSIEESRRILTAARDLGLKPRVHADQLSLNGGAELAAELRAVTADHLEYADAAGIAQLKTAGVQPVLLPGSVLMLGSRRYPNGRAMIEAGLAVVIATDFNPGSSPVASMPLILTLASTQMRMTPAEAITAATINAAYSLGRGDLIGSLEPGKLPDFVIYDCRDYRELAYYPGIDHGATIIIDGEQIYHRRIQQD